MARLEEDKSIASIEEKVTRMEARLKKSSRRRVFSCFNCLVYLIVLLIIGAGFVSYGLAKSGLVDVPILTERVFVEPEPTRNVTPANVATARTALAREIVTQAAPEFLRGGETATISVAITEQLMTGLLHSYLMDDRENSYGAAQIVVLDDDIELFVHRRDRVFILLRAVPTFGDGKLAFDITDFELGNLNLPKSLGNMMLKWAIGDRLSQLNSLFSTFGEVQGIELAPGIIDVEMEINKKSQLLNAF